MPATKILIVDDEQPLRMALARVLQSSGYEICVAGDAIAAVSTAVQERPDLIVLDLGLPAGNGTLVLERLRNLPATSVTPVIVLTGGFIDSDRTQTLRDLGCETVLTKPIAPQQLLAAVTEAFGGPAARDELLGDR